MTLSWAWDIAHGFNNFNVYSNMSVSVYDSVGPGSGWGVVSLCLKSLLQYYTFAVFSSYPDTYTSAAVDSISSWLCQLISSGTFVSSIVSDSTTCDTGELRLIGGSLAREGRLELCFGGQWSTITDDGFSTYDAMVACRTLGYLDGCKLLFAVEQDVLWILLF